MQVLMFLLLIVGNMRNMQYNMQQYAKYANTISICRICTPHFADDDDRAASHSDISAWHAVTVPLPGVAPGSRVSDRHEHAFCVTTS